MQYRHTYMQLQYRYIRTNSYTCTYTIRNNYYYNSMYIATPVHTYTACKKYIQHGKAHAHIFTHPKL